MANAFIEFVKDYRKKNPTLSYKDAMVKASKVYKKQGNTEVSKKTNKTKVKGGSLDDELPKNERNKKIRRFKKVQATVMSDIKDGRINKDMLEAFKKLANELKGHSTTNMYAKALKKVEKILDSKKFQKTSVSLDKRQKQLQTIKELQKNKKTLVSDDTYYKKEQLKLNRIRQRTAELIKRKKEEYKKGKITESTLSNYIAKVKDEVEEEEKKADDLEKKIKILDTKVSKTSSSYVEPTIPITYSNFIKTYAQGKGLKYKEAQAQVKTQDLYKKSISTSLKVKSIEDFIKKYKNKALNELLLEIQGSKKVSKAQVKSAIKQLNNLIDIEPFNVDLHTIESNMIDLNANYDAVLKSRKKKPPPISVKPVGKGKGKVATPPPSPTGAGPAPPPILVPSVVNITDDDLDKYAFHSQQNRRLVKGYVKNDIELIKEELPIGMANAAAQILGATLLESIKDSNIKLQNTPKAMEDVPVDEINDIVGSIANHIRLYGKKKEVIIKYDSNNFPIFGPKPKTLKITVLSDKDATGINTAIDEMESHVDDIYNAVIDSGGKVSEAYKAELLKYESIKDLGRFVNPETEEQFVLTDVSNYKDIIDLKIEELKTVIKNAEAHEAQTGGPATKGEGLYNARRQQDILGDDTEGGSLTSRVMKHFGKHNLVKNVSDEHQLALAVSNSAYKKPNKRKTIIMGYTLDTDISNDENVVYFNDEQKKVIVGFRGSTNFKDFKTDLRLAIGGIKSTSRYGETLEFFKKVIELYEGYSISMTGHSLGGTLAIEMNLLSPSKKAVVFNAGHTPLRSKATEKNDITYYTNKGDLVSGLGLKSYKDVRVLDKIDENPLKAHSLRKFYDEDGKQEDYQGGAFKFLNNDNKKHSVINKVKHSLLELNKDNTLKQKLILAKNIFEDSDKINDKELSKYIKDIAHKLIVAFSN